MGDICGRPLAIITPSHKSAHVASDLYLSLHETRTMSLQGTGYGIECTIIRQSLLELTEPVYNNRNPAHFYKKSRLLLKSDIDFSTSPSFHEPEPRFKNSLHKIYTRLKLFSRRDNKHMPCKDRSNRVFPNKSFRIREDTTDEIAKSRWHVWNTFSHRDSRNNTNPRDTWSPSPPSPTPTGNSDNSLNSAPLSQLVVPAVSETFSQCLGPEHKAPATDANLPSLHQLP